MDIYKWFYPPHKWAIEDADCVERFTLSGHSSQIFLCLVNRETNQRMGRQFVNKPLNCCYNTNYYKGKGNDYTYKLWKTRIRAATGYFFLDDFDKKTNSIVDIAKEILNEEKEFKETMSDLEDLNRS